MYEVDGPGGVPGRVGSGIGHVGSGMGSPKSPRLGGFQSCVCTVLFRDSKQNQIHQAARPYNVDLSEKKIGTSRKKVGISPRECVFRNQRGRFSPLGVQNKGVMEKGLIFDEKC